MALKTVLQDYVRAPAPVLPESYPRYVQDELRKLEVSLKSLVEAIKELDARLTAHGM